jgi:DNA invertase Pin-like site-specific DNA recombinase
VDKATGKLTHRPERDRCFEHLRHGDELVITPLSRPFRSVRHMTELAAALNERSIDLIVLKQRIDTTTPARRFLLHVIAAMDKMTRQLPTPPAAVDESR